MVRNVQPVIRSLTGWIVLLLMILPGITGHGSEAPRFGMLPTSLSDIGYVRVVQKGVYVPVRNVNDVHGVGDRLALVQKNQRYYIAIKEYEDGYAELSAYPRVNFDGGGTAWVTQQNDLIFGAESESSFGRMFLRPSEVLPITAIADDHYVVICERNERVFSLHIPKLTAGIEYQDSLPDHVVQMVEQRNRLEQQLARVKPGPTEGTGFGDSAYSDMQTSTVSTEKIEAAIAAVSPRALDVHPAILQATHAVGTITDSSPFASGSTGVTPAPSVTWPEQISPVIALPQDPPPEQVAVAAADPTPAPVFSAPAQDVVTATPDAVTDVGPVGMPDDLAFDVDERETPLDTRGADEELASGQDVDSVVLMPPHAETEMPDRDEAPAPEAATVVLKPAATDDDSALIELPPIETASGFEDVVPETTDVEAPAPAVTAAILKLLGFLCALAVGFIVIVFGLAKVINRGGGARVADRSASVPLPTDAPTPMPVPEAALDSGAPPAEVVPEIENAEAKQSSAATDFEKDKSGTFTGSLHGFDISELVQFLNASKETGTLSITENNSPNQSKVMFSAGEIVSAFCAGATGEEALAMILSFKDGYFVFKRQLQSTTERTINQSTMSLLMNLHRTRDEGTVPAGG